MADILIDNEAAPATPASGKTVIWVDSTTKKLVQTDDSGLRHGMLSRNVATASQTLGTADTYVTNSGLLIPSFGMEAGQMYRWWISLSKTAAGTAAAVVNFRIGTNQTTADTADLTLTQAAAEAQTALVASALLLCWFTVRNVGASGVIAGGFGFTQTYQATAGNLAFGGGVDGVSGTFANNALAGQYAGLSINAGASSAWTITSVFGELVA